MQPAEAKRAPWHLSPPPSAVIPSPCPSQTLHFLRLLHSLQDLVSTSKGALTALPNPSHSLFLVYNVWNLFHLEMPLLPISFTPVPVSLLGRPG